MNVAVADDDAGDLADGTCEFQDRSWVDNEEMESLDHILIELCIERTEDWGKGVPLLLFDKKSATGEFGLLSLRVRLRTLCPKTFEAY